MTFLLVFSGSTPSSAIEETWTEGNYAEDGYSLVSVWEDGFSYSKREVVKKATNGARLTRWCFEGFSTSAACNPNAANTEAYASSAMPVCKSETQENCIESLSMKNDAGPEVQGVFEKYAAGPAIPADEKYKLYKGASTSVWKVPGILNAGGTDTYAVSVMDSKNYDRWKGKFVTYGVDGGVIPFVEIQDSRAVPPTFMDDGGMVGGGGGESCAWVTTGVCGKTVDHSADVQIKLTIRVSNEISGWFKGRLDNPNIAITKFSSDTVRISVESKPAKVARFLAKEKKEYFTPAIVKRMKHDGSAGASGPNGHSFVYSAWPTWPNASSWLEIFRKNVNDSASGFSTVWNFGTVNYGSGSSCLKDSTRVLGIVTTNATVYNDYAPKFENGFLNYSVSGLHYQPDGTSLNLGTYDFIMRSDVARCLYGLGNAPISATVSVLTDKGVKTTATTVVSEKNGWLKLRAAGFTFSNKTIKVKITKKKK